ncbi:hypothetical protein [Roseibium sp. MMSF_3412]|uniref:hypothetical protein n=1 Tax=Roseibium sp. MMSF_3412 TaxID=3046712 RepID=UPI00273D206C|nr:hypothetical protein [Roseibium sp. MMSF_3412]
MSVNRKLNRLMWFERARTALLVAIVGIPLAIGISMIMVSQSGVNNQDGEPVTGVLLHHSSDYRDDGSIRTTLRVRLADGTEVTVRTRNKGFPAVGEEIVLMKRLRENGRAFYYLPLVKTTGK